MIQVLWYGRGGQGAFTAAKLLGAAYSGREDDCYALAFPSFGPERRGAPIRAFTKLDRRPIRERSEIIHADYIIFLDDTLFSEEAFKELKTGGKILLNTKKKYSDDRVITFDGDTVAMNTLKIPISNTVMLSAFAMIFQGISIKDIENAVKLYMSKKIVEKNLKIIEVVEKEFETERII